MTFKELKTIINTRLSNLVNIDVYDYKPIQARFPYLVFKLTSSSYIKRTREDRILEIDYWNNSNDDTAVMAASDAVKQALNYGWQVEDEGFFRSFIEFEGEIPDPNPDITRINQRYEINIG